MERKNFLHHWCQAHQPVLPTFPQNVASLYQYNTRQRRVYLNYYLLFIIIIIYLIWIEIKFKILFLNLL